MADANQAQLFVWFATTGAVLAFGSQITKTIITRPSMVFHAVRYFQAC